MFFNVCMRNISRETLATFPHLTSNQLFDESLVRVGAGLLVGREEGHLPEGNNGTGEQTEHTEMPLNQT